jgi:pimeloyl-ACP methyl ester carboxylesterase
MMHSRGAGFFSFAYTTLTVSYLIIALLFFTVPSKAMTISGLVLSVFLFVDMCIILGVPQLRVEEGWVGIASVVWATLISIFNILQSQAVAWAKKKEEERLTGREETRRSLQEWIAVLLDTIFMVVIAIVSIIFTATLIMRAWDASLPAPGQKYLVNGEKYQVHLACVGRINGTTDGNGNRPPTVLLEGGEGPVEHSLQPFIDEVYKQGLIDRYCYWDRPGYAWSDNAPSPHSAGMATDALSEALALAGEEGPWILVSSGIGSIYSRIFSSRHLETKGIMLIDPMHEDYLGQIGNAARGFLLWLHGVLSPLRLDRIAGAIFKGRTREDRVYGRSAYQAGKYLKAKLQESLVAESMTASEVQAARHVQMPNTPLVVVSSGLEVRKSEKWAKKQEDLTKITKDLKDWDIVEGAPHEVWRTSEGRQVLEKRLKKLVKGE